MEPALDYLPRLPRRKDFRVGCLGAGFIMRDCHLVAIASRDPKRVHTAAAQQSPPSSTSTAGYRPTRKLREPCA